MICPAQDLFLAYGYRPRTPLQKEIDKMLQLIFVENDNVTVSNLYQHHGYALGKKKKTIKEGMSLRLWRHHHLSTVLSFFAV